MPLMSAVLRNLSDRLSTRNVVMIAWAATGLCCVYYYFLLTNGDFNLLTPEPYSAIFNRMAWNLLHWRFTIEPDVLSDEAFVWHGATYSYFGILPALLRLPLVILYGVDPPNVSRLSCWAGLCIVIVTSTSIILHTLLSVAATKHGNLRVLIVLGATQLTAPLLSMAFASYVYNEPIIWGTALAMLFLRSLLLHILGPPLSAASGWLAMGVLAGVAFSARPTTATCMTVALALMVLIMPLSPSTGRPLHGRPRLDATVRAAVWAGIGFIPLFTMAMLVNWERWGDPTIFAPAAAHIQVLADPRRMRVATERGIFEFDRLSLGFGYYFLGMSGHGWLAALVARVSDGLGYPRSAFAATSTTQLLLGLFGCYSLARRRLPGFLCGWSGLCVATGPVLLAAMTLTLMYMNYRYRLEFLPFFTVCAISGAAGLGRFPSVCGQRGSIALTCLLLINIGISHLDLLQAKLTSYAQTESTKQRIGHATWPVSELFMPIVPGIGRDIAR